MCLYSRVFFIVDGESLGLLRTIQDNLVAGISPGRTVVGAGGFRLLLTLPDPLFYLNQAVPISEPLDVGSMLAAFEEHGRRPWLEFCVDLWPDLPPLLESAGLVRHQQMPVMVLDRARYQPMATSARIAETGDVAGSLGLAASVFGMGSTNSDAIEAFTKALESGRTISAVKEVGGRIISCGSAVGTPVCRELAGIATREDFRRQGHATDVIRCLLVDHFGAEGEIAWLTPGDDGAEEAYRRCGFVEMATQVGYGPSDVELSIHS